MTRQRLNGHLFLTEPALDRFFSAVGLNTVYSRKALNSLPPLAQETTDV